MQSSTKSYLGAQSRANRDYGTASTGGHTKYEGIGQVGFIRDTLSVNNEVIIKPDNNSKTVVGVGEVFSVNNVIHKDKVHMELEGPSNTMCTSNKSYKAIEKIRCTKIHAGGPGSTEYTGNESYKAIRNIDRAEIHKEGLGNTRRTSKRSYTDMKTIHGAEVRIGGPSDNKCTGKRSYAAMKKIHRSTGGPSDTACTAVKKIDESDNITQEMKFDI